MQTPSVRLWPMGSALARRSDSDCFPLRRLRTDPLHVGEPPLPVCGPLCRISGRSRRLLLRCVLRDVLIYVGGTDAEPVQYLAIGMLLTIVELNLCSRAVVRQRHYDPHRVGGDPTTQALDRCITRSSPP